MNPSFKLTYRRLVPPVLAYQKRLDNPDCSTQSDFCSSSVSQALIGFLSRMNFPPHSTLFSYWTPLGLSLGNFLFWKTSLTPTQAGQIFSDCSLNNLCTTLHFHHSLGYVVIVCGLSPYRNDKLSGDLPVVQRLRLGASNAEGTGSTLG